MAFSKGSDNLMIDGYRFKRVAVTAPSGDAHTTEQAFVFNGTAGAANYGMTRPIVSAPTEFGIINYTGVSGQAKQSWSIVAVSATGFTIRKNTAAAGATNCVLLCWFRFPRGVAR